MVCLCNKTWKPAMSKWKTVIPTFLAVASSNDLRLDPNLKLCDEPSLFDTNAFTGLLKFKLKCEMPFASCLFQ